MLRVLVYKQRLRLEGNSIVARAACGLHMCLHTSQVRLELILRAKLGLGQVALNLLLHVVIKQACGYT